VSAEFVAARFVLDLARSLVILVSAVRILLLGVGVKLDAISATILVEFFDVIISVVTAELAVQGLIALGQVSEDIESN